VSSSALSLSSACRAPSSTITPSATTTSPSLTSSGNRLRHVPVLHSGAVSADAWRVFEGHPGTGRTSAPTWRWTIRRGGSR
jgi:hypothetical protein